MMWRMKHLLMVAMVWIISLSLFACSVSERVDEKLSVSSDEGGGSALEAPSGSAPAPTLPESSLSSFAARDELVLWHRWPEERAATLRAYLDHFESRHSLRIRMIRIEDLYSALERTRGTPEAPDLVLLPGDRIAGVARAGAISSLDIYLEPDWLEENYLPQGLSALRLDGQLWGLPISLQTLTFIFNRDLISPEELSAQTDDLLVKAQAFQEAHAEIRYLVYPVHNDVYFAAPWFYGAGAWYSREDGSVGLATPAGRDAATFLVELQHMMPPGLTYGQADALFKSGQAAIILNGPWYLSELEAAGIRYGLQIMPVVSSSGQPARPFVTVEGVSLGSYPGTTHPDTIGNVVRLMAFLTGPDCGLELARDHRIIPANQFALARAEEEGLNIVVHFGRQAALGEALPASPYMELSWDPLRDLLAQLAAGEDPAHALSQAQREVERRIRAAGGD